MASRPFSTISVEIERKFDPTATDKKDHLDSVLRRRKKVKYTLCVSTFMYKSVALKTPRQEKLCCNKWLCLKQSSVEM